MFSWATSIDRPEWTYALGDWLHKLWRWMRETPYYIHMYEIWLESGGPEEGGWNYTQGSPIEAFTPVRSWRERKAYERCRALNIAEKERAKNDEEYGFTSVLSYQSTHYDYTVETTAQPTEYPVARPHYE